MDELIFLDILATKQQKPPNLKLLKDIANECFMPLAYGGGISEFSQAQKILEIGFEKVSINSNATTSQRLISTIAETYGSQSVIASVDVRRNRAGNYLVYTHSGTASTGRDPVSWIKELESAGAGEVLLTSIDREGTWEGFDLELIQKVSCETSVPVVAHGGAGCSSDIDKAIDHGASAVALGSMVVFQKKGMGVLVNFPVPSARSFA